MGWIEQEIETSKIHKRCTPALASWVLSVADRTLREEYGDNYSMQCLQSSECIRSVLSELGIRSILILGDMCAAVVYTGPPPVYGWSGFWGKDHHVWQMTEFGELIDLTISQLHLHPVWIRDDAYPIPALWWQTLGEMPCVFKYLHRGKGVIISKLPDKDMEILGRLRRSAVALCQSEMSISHQPKKIGIPILYNVLVLDYLCKIGHPWASRALIFQNENIPLPPWIAHREAELLRPYR